MVYILEFIDNQLLGICFAYDLSSDECMDLWGKIAHHNSYSSGETLGKNVTTFYFFSARFSEFALHLTSLLSDDAFTLIRFFTAGVISSLPMSRQVSSPRD